METSHVVARFARIHCNARLRQGGLKAFRKLFVAKGVGADGLEIGPQLFEKTVLGEERQPWNVSSGTYVVAQAAIAVAEGAGAPFRTVADRGSPLG